MKSEDLLRLLSEIDSELVEKVMVDIDIHQSSREGVSFRVEPKPRRFPRKTVIASAAGAAAAVLGVFVLLLNIGNLGLVSEPESSEQSGSFASSGTSAVWSSPTEENDGYNYDFDLSVADNNSIAFSDPAEKTNELMYARVKITGGTVSENCYVHMAVFKENDFWKEDNRISASQKITDTQKEIALTYTDPRALGSSNYLCAWGGYYGADISGRWDP